MNSNKFAFLLIGVSSLILFVLVVIYARGKNEPADNENVSSIEDNSNKQTTGQDEYETYEIETVVPSEADIAELNEILESNRSAYIDGFECESQLPELPAGCEVTSLSMALKFKGYSVDKMTIVNKYLDIGETKKANPYKQFVGDPADEETGYGCYSPVIIKCVQKIGANVLDYSHRTFSSILDNVEKGQPVVIWATIDMNPTIFGSSVWKDNDGNVVCWRGNEHCVVLVGFDTSKNEVYVADPLTGKIETYSLSVFYTRWVEQNKQALVVF
ncbi:MAG: C39 family peptidase [Lachnospira sp.]